MEDYREIDEWLARVFNSEIVFIVGATRWGTAWVQQCMDAHPEVCCKGEAHFADILFPMLARGMDEYNSQCEAIGNRLQAAGLPGNAAGYTVGDVNFFLKVAVGLVFARWTGDGDYKCIAEKTPEHVLSLEVLEKVMPGCKIVHVVRDGRDEAVSAWDFNLGISRGDFPRKYPSFGDFSEVFARNWSRSVGAAKRFGGDHPERYLSIRSEDLLDDPAPVVRRLFQFAGVEDDAALAKDAMDSAWDASPVHLEPGAWKTAFDDESLRIFQRQCGELLKLMGYED